MEKHNLSVQCLISHKTPKSDSIIKYNYYALYLMPYASTSSLSPNLLESKFWLLFSSLQQIRLWFLMAFFFCKKLLKTAWTSKLAVRFLMASPLQKKVVNLIGLNYCLQVVSPDEMYFFLADKKTQESLQVMAWALLNEDKPTTRVSWW